MSENDDAASLALPAGGPGFDPIKDRLRSTVSASIEAMFEAFIGCCRYGRGDGVQKGYRHWHRERQITGTFGSGTVRVSRARSEAGRR